MTNARRIWTRGWLVCLLLACGVARGDQTSWNQAILLADQLQRQGEYADAETTLLSALKQATVLGPESPELAATLNYLGYVSQDLGRYAESEKYYQRSLRIWETIRDKDAPELVRTLSNLLSLYSETNQLAKAERLSRRCREINPEALGPDSLDAARLLHNLASLALIQRKYPEAESLYRKALAILEKRSREERPEVATALNNLGLVESKLAGTPKPGPTSSEP